MKSKPTYCPYCGKQTLVPSGSFWVEPNEEEKYSHEFPRFKCTACSSTFLQE